jgi:hypothetical protein
MSKETPQHPLNCMTTAVGLQAVASKTDVTYERRKVELVLLINNVRCQSDFPSGLVTLNTMANIQFRARIAVKKFVNFHRNQDYRWQHAISSLPFLHICLVGAK